MSSAFLFSYRKKDFMKNSVAKRKKALIDLTFLIPALLVLLFVVGIPFFQGLGISLTNWDGFTKEKNFVGLRNLYLLVKDTQVINAIQNTLLYTCITAVGVNALALLLAVLLDGNVFGKRFLRSVLFLPMIVSLVVAAFMWTRIYGDVLPTYFNIMSPLVSVKWAVPGIALICLWRDTGLAMVIYNAGLQSVPESLKEAARIDGANNWQIFRNITFPLIAPAFTTCVTLWLGYGLKVFDYPKAATNGGPGKASETFALYVYNNFFSNNRAGYGQMASIVMFLVVILITNSVTKILRKREVEV